MQRKWIILAISAVIGVMLTGCSELQGDVGNKNIRPNSVKYDANGNRMIDKRFANDQMNEMNRINGRRLNSNNVIGTHRNYHIDMSEKAADRVTGMMNVDAAYVMMGDKNAYVAIVPQKNDGGEVSSAFKHQIAAEIKAMNPDIVNVYVSANPDFVGRMTNYMNYARSGKPVQALIAEFNAMVDRIFPADSGTSIIR
ncbi:YhcN/YlaJ family sporulation lipoprotein [Paenibacillus abyssi]|uniref:Lipoprotein YhcN n=1 Tax=Paenibacillus abyssi TaxID=1340531 RepID=A0A917FRY1_9BACL|nr:YhcN/YlaJ family sporulation lipoprotein [Paenibacillus abyssi]GGF98653.1 lipoprotein YhcN [Paenibacillus abyssi]